MRGKSPFDVYGGKLNYNFFCWQMLFFVFLLLVIMARKSTARKIDNGISDDGAGPRVYCFRNGLKVKVKTLKPFTGVLYVKGMAGNPLCMKNFTGTTDTPGITIAYEDCIHSRERLAHPQGMTFMVTIVAQFHPFFTTSIDRAFIVTCTYRESVQSVTNKQILQGHVGGGPNGEGGSDSEAIPTSKLSYTPVLPLCKYTIHRGTPQGPVISYARVGEKTFHKWQCYPSSDGEFHGLLVHNCVARAGNGVQIKLLDGKGCTLDPFAMGTPTYAQNLTLAYVEVHAFKFADDLQISFSCSISLCLRINNRCRGITPPSCTSDSRGSGNSGGSQSGGYGAPQPPPGQGGGYGAPQPPPGQGGGYPSPGSSSGGSQGGGYGAPPSQSPSGYASRQGGSGNPQPGGFPAIAVLPEPPAPPPGYGSSGSASGSRSGSNTFYPPGYSQTNQQSFPSVNFPSQQSGKGAQLIGGQIRPPAPQPLDGSYALLSDAVVHDFSDFYVESQNKRSPLVEKPEPELFQDSFKDSISFHQGFQGNLSPQNTSSVLQGPEPQFHPEPSSEREPETEGFGYVSFGTSLNSPSLALIDLPNLPPLPPEELEFLKEIQRDARELGRSVSHHKMPGTPQENPTELDQISDGSMDLSANDFIVFDRKAEIPELLRDPHSEFSDEYPASSCETGIMEDYCISRIIFIQVTVAVTLSFTCFFSLAVIFWLRSRRKLQKGTAPEPPMLTFHYDNISEDSSVQSDTPNRVRHGLRRSYDEPNL